MTKTTKILISILLMYSCVMGVILLDNGFVDSACQNFFSFSFCKSPIRFLWILLPIVIFGIYTLWEKNITTFLQRLFHKLHNKKKNKKAIKEKIKQPMVGIFESIGRFIMKSNDFFGVAQRSEFWWIFTIFFVFGFAFAYIPNGKDVFNTLLALCFLPIMALLSRRFHDIGVSAKLLSFPYIILLITVFSPILFGVLDPYSLARSNSYVLGYSIIMYLGLMLIYMLLPSNYKNNKYRDLQKKQEYTKWVIFVWIAYAIIIFNKISYFINLD